MNQALKKLNNQLEGELHQNQLWRSIYATDASVYRKLPTAVAMPKNKEDLKKIIHFARENRLSLIPRAGGTSLAGQCVGSGMVVDVSKYFNQIVELNVEERWVRVQPGIVRDQLNHYLKPHGLFFSPVTSTASRAMIGGMVGNNSCGTTSIVYGSTRDHAISLTTLLSDGSECVFEALDQQAFDNKRKGDSLESRLYQQIFEILSPPGNQAEIHNEYPKKSIHRRNTGYAIDLLLDQQPFAEEGPPFNFCTLLCGSEGTLAFTTEIKLNLDPLPLPEEIVVCLHFESVVEAMKATQIAMTLPLTACELIDKVILDCTKANVELRKNRFFVQGDPGAILLVEFRSLLLKEAEANADELIAKIKSAGLGYAFPKVFAPQTKKVWELRSSGLGVLANLPGDAKSLAFIEDTAVALEDLPKYIEEFEQIMDRYGQQSVYYGHAGAGELHLRPILDLKKAEDQQLFYDISRAIADLVKKKEGSLSGEHGDGRVRAEFIPMMIGKKNYELLRQIKQTWDPDNIFNPGKIVDAPPMKGDFRYEANQTTPDYQTVMDFSEAGGYIRMIEKCNGVGACRKLPETGGTMCPSYMATRNEKDTTRARANALREFMGKTTNGNPFDSQEIFDILKYCLSCKGCTNECPSNVDMSALKAEFLHQYYQTHRRPLSDLAFGNIGRLGKLATQTAMVANWTMSNSFTGGIIKKILGVAPQRSLPAFSNGSLRQWYQKNYSRLPKVNPPKGSLYFFCDDFSNYQDTEIGIKAIQLLVKLGYDAQLVPHVGSGRAPLSKGLLTLAKRLANENVNLFSALVTTNKPLVGIEPSAILTFRDEYLRLADEKIRAAQLKPHVFLFEEFLFREMQKGNISCDDFTDRSQHILLHGHCHQKAIAGVDASAFVLGLPSNYEVEVIPSGCCGMAGSFGYEKANYELSMQIGELVLFPAVRQADEATIIAAPGTSCRHQIFDGTRRQALHPLEILWNAMS